VVTDIGDLVLRMGRLAWDDPQWTPDRGRGARLRTAADLAAGGPVIAAVVGAVHQAADAFAHVAATDLAAVTAAGSAGRLYVRTRSLPDGYDVPRPYASAPADRTRPLLDAYTKARQASRDAAGALAELAVATNAPSSTLALARAASALSPQIAEQDQIPATAAASEERGPGAGQSTPGPIEQTVRKLRVKDPMVLLRAAAIDDAGQQLITQAEQLSSLASPRSAGVTAHRGPLGGSARLAAKDSPLGLAATLATSESRSTVGTSTRPESGRNPLSRPAPRPGHRQGPRRSPTP
jgi:hypothetical protein